MYVVLNTTNNTLYATGLDKEALEKEIVEMKRVTGDDFQLFSPASDKVPEQLELLYALTIQLLTVGKVNPLFIKLELVNLLGEVREVTARQIVNDARAYLDAIDRDELSHSLRKIADKALDPMIKNALTAVIDKLP